MSEADLDDIFGADEPSQPVNSGNAADLDDIFGAEEPKQRSAAPKAGTLADLFDDDDDDDDNAVAHQKPAVKRSNIDDLFDSDDSGSDQDVPSKPKRLSHKKKRKFEDSDEDDNGEPRHKKKVGSDRKIRRKEKKLRPNREKRREKPVDESGNPIDDGDAYDSGEEPTRTKDDDDFLSDESDDDNAAVLREYDGDNQDFDDERPTKKHSKKSLADPSSGARARSAAGAGKTGGNDPFSVALASLKAKKVEAWTDSEKQAYVDRLQLRMREACKHDDDILALNRARAMTAPPQPALQKLEMLESVQHALSMSMLWNTMLDREILITLGYWIRPRADNSLPALPIRTAIYESLLKLPCMPDHLKKSSLIPGTEIFIKPIGQIIFELLKHKQETIDNKKLLRAIIDKWSREIFSKGTEISAQSMTAYRNDAEVQARLASKYDAAQQARLKAEEEAKYQKDNHQRARAPLILGHMFTVQPDIDKKALKRAQKAKDGNKDDEAMEVKDRTSGGEGDGGSGGGGGAGKNAEGGRAALLKRMEGGRGGSSAGSDSKRAVNVSVARPSYDFH
jgi:hypothetical protein